MHFLVNIISINKCKLNLLKLLELDVCNVFLYKKYINVFYYVLNCGFEESYFYGKFIKRNFLRYMSILNEKDNSLLQFTYYSPYIYYILFF